jgi:hypothetical protein
LERFVEKSVRTAAVKGRGILRGFAKRRNPCSFVGIPEMFLETGFTALRNDGMNRAIKSAVSPVVRENE